MSVGARWLLVPTERHVETLAESGREARTLRKLVRELAREQAPDCEPATPEITRLLTAELLGAGMQQARSIDDSIGRLRRAGMSQATLRATELPRGELFAEWMTSADAWLNRCSLRDDRDANFIAAKRLQGPQELPNLPRGSAVIRGLGRWDASTLVLLEALHARLRAQGYDGVSLELPRNSVPFVQAAIDALTTSLEARWASHNDAPSLDFVESHPLDEQRVQLVEAYDASSEARAVAYATLEAVARGVPLDRIAIVPVDLSEAFLEPLRFELSRARIPFAEPRGRPAIAAPRTHAALELLRLVRGPLSRDALVDVLRVPGLRWESWFGAHARTLPHELSQLPLRVERLRGELLFELAQRSEERQRRRGPLELERHATLSSGLARLLEELAAIGAEAPRETHARRVLELFDRIGLLEPALPALRLGIHQASELLTGMGHDAVAAAALRTAAERTVAAASALGLAAQPVGFARWLEELELALEGVAEGRGAARAAAVRIARPADVAGSSLHCLILCRASDQSLDRAPSADPALGAPLSAALKSFEAKGANGSEQQFTLLTVASALAKAKNVVLTWARHDESDSLAPSRLARALARTLPVQREPASVLAPTARRLLAPAALSAGATLRRDQEQGRLAFYADPTAPATAWSGDAGSLTDFFGHAARPLAVTLLERALSCRFLAFAGRVLGAIREDAVSDAVGFKERGSLVHEALAAALAATAGRYATLGSEEFMTLALEAARVALERRGNSPLRRIGIESALRDVAAMLEFIDRGRGDLSFRSAETGFGTRDGWAPLEVGSHRLSGRIDRIDVSNDGRRLRVIDYKTRKSSARQDELALQPWLYAERVGREFSAEQIEFSYLSLDGRRPNERVVYRGPLGGPEIQAAFARTEQLLAGLVRGEVVPRPDSATRCARCDARDLCRRPLSAPESPEDE